MRKFLKERDGFKVGDRVEVFNYYIKEFNGMTGTIYKIDEDSGLNFDVILDNFTDGHDGHAGDRSTNHRFFSAKDLELLSSIKHKVGDWVQVRSYLSTEKSYGGIYPSEQMLHKVGQKVRIKAVTKTGRYKIEGSCFTWTNEMFEETKNETKVEPKPKNTHRYNVGDKVRVRENLKSGFETEYYMEDGITKDSFVDPMKKWCGKIVTIRDINSCGKYTIREDAWNWTDEMFEDVDKPVEEKHIPNIEVGCVVRAVDNYYVITNLANEWEGVVISVSNGEFTAITTNHKNLTHNKYDRYWCLDPKHFEIIKKNT